MMPKGSAFVVVFTCLITSTISFALAKASQESEQQISDFSLSGYGEKKKKAWDISGKSADIFDDVVRLKNIVGNLYGKEENVNLIADKGDFNKKESRIRLEENVVITSSSGARLTTNSLDWDRKNQVVATKDVVNIEKGNIVSSARGALGKADLNNLTLEKDVKVEIRPETPADKKETGDDEKIIITCDGPLEIDYKNNVATLNNNVKVERQDYQIYSDTMDVYFISSRDSSSTQEASVIAGSKIDRIIARGNVRIIRGENISYSDEAVYTASDKKITLNGRPKLVFYSVQDLEMITGE